MGWVTPALGIASYITGAKDRKKANEAANAYSDQLRSIIAQAEATYGPEATERAIGKAMGDVATEYQNARTSSERNLYARGMGERTAGSDAALAEAEAKNRLGARNTIETTYPQLLLQAKQGTLGSLNDYAQQTGAAASEATALPFQLYGMYQGMKGNQAYMDYLKAMTKKAQGGTSGTAGSVGDFYPASYT